MTNCAELPWNSADVPIVSAADLMPGLAMWHARERQAIHLVTADESDVHEEIERTILAAHAAEPARALSIIARTFCAIAALDQLRFRHLARAADHADLAPFARVVATMRLNTDFGLSPLRIAWALEHAAAPAEAVERIAA